MDVFEMRTGKFTPLSDAQVDALNPDQLKAYGELFLVVDELNKANAEAESAIAANRTAVFALHAAEAAEAKKPKYTQLDAHRASIAQWRKDH
jgi:hypothetical protein